MRASYHHGTNISDGKWHHVAFMVGNSGNNDPYSLYLDGSKIRSSSLIGLDTVHLARISK